MLGMTATFSVVSDSADVELDGFRLGYVAADGTQHRLSLADAWAVRFEAMAPARRVQGSERSAASAGPVVVIDDGWSRRVRVMAGTRPVDVVWTVTQRCSGWYAATTGARLDLRGLVCREIRRPEPASVNQ
jgi:hypothetical protein